MGMNRYELLGTVGEGAMGVVWHAHDHERGIGVALKTLRPELARWPEVVQCLKTEADICSRMLSPHVVQVLDSSSHPGEAYIAYELLHGETLGAHLAREKTLSLDMVRDVVTQVSRALSRVHALGVVHRDIKPDNIFLVPRIGGRFHVKVIDFGIADEGAHPVDFAGTPEYMPPEVLLGQRRASRSADLYALGVVAFECLTGRCPYPGASADDLLELLHADPPALEDLRTDLPSGVSAWMARAIHRDASQRFASAKDLSDALTKACSAPEPVRRYALAA
ncbi:MAG: serine/threonine protein kinase [Myxococcales bacterium]|nr:serine/threonine protein kinase [Myxococcales bacterium]